MLQDTRCPPDRESLMRILMVEDHQRFAQAVIAEFLEDHDVIIAAGVNAAREQLAGERFEVVLVDYDLPDGKGDEVVRWMRANDLDVPVVAVSSHEFGNTQLRQAGANAVCSKMKFRQLPAILRKVAAGED